MRGRVGREKGRDTAGTEPEIEGQGRENIEERERGVRDRENEREER